MLPQLFGEKISNCMRYNTAQMENSTKYVHMLCMMYFSQANKMFLCLQILKHNLIL